MKLRYTHTRLLVADFAACFRFYSDVLGLKPRFGSQAGPYEEFQTGQVILALFESKGMADSLPGVELKPPGDSVVLTFEVDDVDAAYESLLARGVSFVAPPADRPAWLIRTAHFRDPAGNLLEINSPLGVPTA